MRRLYLPALAATTMLFAASLSAQPPHGGPLGGLGPLGPDGTLTRADLSARLEKRFTELDGNHDGRISAAERKAERERRWNARFDAMDSDHDGKLSRAELHAAHDRPAHDGRKHGPHRGHGDHGAPPPPPGAHSGPDHGPGGQDRTDLNREQFLARPLALFDRIDTDHDGRITATERAAARPGKRGRRD